MKRWQLTIAAYLSVVSTALAQQPLSWNVLADVQFEMQYMKEYEMRMMVPIFGQGPKSYEGKEVTITGYIIPLNASNTMFVLSKNPYASCFFCGGAGQETIVELWLKPEAVRRYKMDQRMTFKGIFKLNATDINNFNYILTNAEPVQQ